MLDRICAGHDIGHLLTAPRSPTATGKVERWHKTLRKESLTGKVFASITDAQDQLDTWVHQYNHDRPHQSIGRVLPFERFRLAPPRPSAVRPAAPVVSAEETGPTRVVSRAGTVSFAGVRYPVGAWLAGQRVQVVCDGGLVQISHAGIMVATLARRHDPARQTPATRRATPPRPPRPTPSAAAVTRKVDSSGNVSFAGVAYPVGAAWAHRQVQVAVVGRTVETSACTQLIRTHTARHDPTRELGAFANPRAAPDVPPRPGRLSPTYGNRPVVRVPRLDTPWTDMDAAARTGSVDRPSLSS